MYHYEMNVARSLFVVALLAAVLVEPAAAAAPRFIVASGLVLRNQVVLDDHSENLRLYISVVEAKRRVDSGGLTGRPVLDLAMYWGDRWETVARTEGLDPAEADQHGRFYPATGDEPAIIQLPLAEQPGPVQAPKVALSILRRHGVPTRGAYPTAEVCGASGCEAVHLPVELSGLLDLSTEIPPPPVAPYYEIRGSEGDRWFFVPSSRALKPPVQGDGYTWLRIPQGALDPAVSPWPPPVLSEVHVGGRKARDPARYLGLFDTFPVVAPPQPGARRVWIVLRSERASPWSVSVPLPFPKRTAPWVNGFNLLEYIPSRDTLYRSGEFVRLPPNFADAIEDDAGVADSPGQSAARWVGIGGLAVALGAAALSFWILYLRPRRIRRPRRRVT
jgi:hypothetical protein